MTVVGTFLSDLLLMWIDPRIRLEGRPTIAAELRAEERVAVASQWQLMWWRFRRHRLAMLGSRVVRRAVLLRRRLRGLPGLRRSRTPPRRSARFIPPQRDPLVRRRALRAPRLRAAGRARPRDLQARLHAGPGQKIPVRFFVHGFDYRLFGLIPTDRHLLGVEGARPEEALFLLGTDQLGRDLWSRLMYGTRTSLTIGLAGVAFSLVLGVFLGGISGLYGGSIDTVIQRVIEILRSIPTIPLWMGLAAALPNDWTRDRRSTSPSRSSSR